MDEPIMNTTPQTPETVTSLRLHKDKPQKTAQDWVRDMRMSAAVNKSNTGVETDQVTPDLLLATSKKLLGISKREQEPDAKDSLAFQRFYGPEMLFQERILRDGGKLARNILWKATNRGNLDFMPVNALEKHISSVFYDSKLAQMMDGSSPLETIDAAYKTTRIGEGGVQSQDSAPDEMRTVQPSYFGYIDPVRCYAEDTELMTESGWKKVQDITGDDKLACLINGRLEYHRPTALSVYDYNGTMYGYDDGHIAYLVTPNHRMYTRCADAKRNGEPCRYNTRSAEDIHGTHRMVNTGMHLPILRNEDETVFHLPQVVSTLKHEQIYGMPPQGVNLRNVDEIDIVDFAEYMGWYLSEGCFTIDQKRGYYRVDISQSPMVNPNNYVRIKELIERLPFKAKPMPLDKAIERKHKVLSIGRKQLAIYLSQFGKSDAKFIPEWIFNAPLKARLAFREAMLLGDGRDQRHLCTKSRRLAEDFARLQFELGESVKILHEKEDRYPNHPGIWVVYWHSRKEMGLQRKIKRHNTVPYFTQQYTHKVYCPTVPGGLVYCRKSESYQGFWNHQSPESYRVGLDVYMTKNVMKGTDGKLYQKFIDAKTGKEVLLDSETAANSVIAAPEMMHAKTKSIFALGGPTGVRIVPRDSVQYYLPRADEAYSTSSNLVTMLSGVKEMRLQMGCLHPDTQVLTIDKKNLITIDKAQVASIGRIPGSTKDGKSQVFDIRTTVAKFPPKRGWFYKIVLRSGRTLITSADHKWSVLRKGNYELIPANKLKVGDQAFRTTFKDVISRRTFVNGILVNKDIATVFGYIARSLTEPDNEKLRITIPEDKYDYVRHQLARLGYTEGFNTYYMNYAFCVGIRDPKLKKFLIESFGADERDRKIPSFIMSAGAAIVGAFLNGYTSDPTRMGRDSADDFWVLDIPNIRMRDSLAFLFARIETDTLYRDAVNGNHMDIALKLVPVEHNYGDMILDDIIAIKHGITAPIMIDIDVNDNLYAVANGIVTHNSKYPLQAISVQSREAPLVRGLDEATGKDMHSLIGKYLGARFAPQDGIVTAVRKDRINVQYADGTKGSVDLYVNFPMNAKGFINNTPQVKTGQAFKKGDCLASSNYTDDKGVAALGTNLRSAWMSWKGGTYEDAIVISESAAKKLTSDTMYKTSVDLDKTVKLGKKNYLTWKPGEFTKEQMEALDDNGIVKPGTVLHKEDPMILAVRTTEPSPGTMGKRILTDMSERWEHDHPGVVTDVVKTRNGIKVYATVTAPVEIGDKLSGGYGNKGTVAQIIPDDQMPHDKDGNPIDIILSPLGLISRTNNSQLYEGLLGKIAAKTGKPITVPQFMEGSFAEYVADQLKQNGLKADETLIDPETGRKMENIITGRSYIYKLKHMAESKLSARGTDEYSADETPGGKGMSGCFPSEQLVGCRCSDYKSIKTIAKSLNTIYVASCSDDKKNRYHRAIDKFIKLVPASEILSITAGWNFSASGKYMQMVHPMFPTKNHAIYMYDMTQKHAGNLKIGDKIAGMGNRPSDDQMQVLSNVLSMEGIVDNDVFTVVYPVDHDKLFYFKYKMLKSIGATIDRKNCTFSIPHYALYSAAITAADFGNLAVALHQLDSDAICATDGKIAQIIAQYISYTFIPDTKPQLKQFVKKAQKINPPVILEAAPKMGVMPMVIAKIEPYKTDKESVKVYDLTVETTHRYVLKGGYIVSNSKRFGTLEQSAMAGHGAFDVIKDAKYVRGQANSDFWRSLRVGDIPTMPGEPLIHKKFFAHLSGAGINVKKTPQGVSIFALTNNDVSELAGPRELRSRDTYEARNFRPIDGGLFGQDIFGINGDKWGYIQLDSPVPNPVMEEPLARLLGIPEKKFADVAAGKEEINGIKGGASMKAALEKINLDAESARALNNFKTATPSGKDKMLKRYIAIERMRRAGVNPAEYMLDKIPVIPPKYRPITSYNGLTMVADSNYLYAQLLDARDDAREAVNLPQEYQDQAQENIYNKWKELTGIYAPQDVKLQSKHVQGLLKWALGDSPKFGKFQRSVLSTAVDTVGRGVITPDPRLKLNEVGLPEVMAFNIMGPMVQRKLVKQGYTPFQAMEKVKARDVQARDALNEVMTNHPVLINRAPTLHKLSIIGLNPRLVTGNAIRINPSIVSTLAADFDGDTVNIHAPVTDKAREEAYKKMLPERNLIGMRDRKILYKPEKEYQQGLYIATRMKSGPDVRVHYFNTLDEAKQAYREGLIDVDDPIVIKEK